MGKGQYPLLIGIIVLTLIVVSLGILYYVLFRPNIVPNNQATTTTSSPITTTTSSTTVTTQPISTTSTTSSTTTQQIQPQPAIGDSVGGSNYIAINIGNYNDACQGWYQGEIKFVVPSYNTMQQTVRQQLQSMYDNGQRKIVLVIWFGPLQNESAATDNKTVWGHIVSDDYYSYGALSPQHQENLKNLIADIKSIGFNEIVMRLAADREENSPGSSDWQTWNEDQYQRNLQFIENTRSIVNFAWCSNAQTCGGNGLLYDLSPENAGIYDAETVNYTKSLWRDYTAAFGNDDTFGFSFVADWDLATRVNNMLDIYDSSSAGRPGIYAIEIYDNATWILNTFDSALSQRGVTSPVIILESYYNDAQELQELQSAVQSTGREVLFLAQWPFVRNAACPCLSIDYPQNYGNYLK